MRKLPIPFSGAMVRAILREIEQRGTGKTQTRRVIDFPAIENVLEFVPVATDKQGRRVYEMKDKAGAFVQRPAGKHFVTPHFSPPYAVGDRLYVREAWHAARSLDNTPPRDIPRDADIEHAATARSYAEIGLKGKLRPAMFLPRWASRITLIVTDVRVQRLQEISAEDARDEGVDRLSRSVRQIGLFGASSEERDAIYLQACRWEFEAIWNSLNAERAPWESNPWVAAYTFRPILGNVDRVEP